MKLPPDYLDKNSQSRILSDKFSSYSIVNRIERLYQYYDANEILVTSSFGANAAYLLHLISRIKPEQKIHFIDTGFHFKETIQYKEKIKKLLNVELVELRANEADYQYSAKNKLWESDPDKCCHLNKIKPLSRIKNDFKVWVSGLRKDQTSFRASLNLFEDNEQIIKYYPLYDLDYKQIKKYLNYFKIPTHPMAEKGYGSIGCTHCTVKGSGRDGRWNGNSKTECGLHPDYLQQKSDNFTV